MKPDKKAALMLVYGEKAFDIVTWKFMQETLEKMGLGEKICKGMQAIYTAQRARLIINELSEFFDISKETRQGCSLSPLLFIIVLETFLKAIREDQITIGILKTLEKMKEFGHLSGFKINKDKTKLMVKNLNLQEKEELEKETGLKISNKARYLGIWITMKNINLYKDNYIKT